MSRHIEDKMEDENEFDFNQQGSEDSDDYQWCPVCGEQINECRCDG